MANQIKTNINPAAENTKIVIGAQSNDHSEFGDPGLIMAGRDVWPLPR
jgi:hypothetical protein